MVENGDDNVGDNDAGVGDIGEENDDDYENNGETLLLIWAVFPDKGDTVIGNDKIKIISNKWQ